MKQQLWKHKSIEKEAKQSRHVKAVAKQMKKKKIRVSRQWLACARTSLCAHNQACAHRQDYAYASSWQKALKT